MLGVWRRWYSMGVSKAAAESPKPWKDAASLIIAAPSGRKTAEKYSTDYRILVLKRVAKSSFFPNAYVYPGGAIDEADKHPNWIDVFEKIHPSFCNSVSENFFVKQNDGKRSPLFPGDNEALKNGILPNEIAFRICAIRESFEESGLLLLTDDVKSRLMQPDAIHAKSVTPLLNNDAVEKWRKKVHNDANEFMNLCIELQKVPDIWSLKEWSEWLTPPQSRPGRKGMNKRYDTVFYSCCLKEAPSYFHHDKVEMSDSIWISPAEIIQMFLLGKVLLAPPQVFEIRRILNFSSVQEFSSFMNQRALKGMQRYMPYWALTKDGILIVFYPGDDLYPKNIDLMGKEIKVMDKTYDEIINSSGNHFNFLIDKDQKFMLTTMTCNVTLPYGHVTPICINNFQPSSKM